MKIAVCIPVYRPPSWYELECLTSVVEACDYAREAGHEVELRIGIDGDPLALERTLAFGESCWFSAENVGHAVLRNSLHVLGPADAYAYFDADDWMHREHLTVHAAALPVGGATMSTRIESMAGKADALYPHAGATHLGGGTGLISHAALTLVGGFDSARCGADTYLRKRLRLAGVPFVAVREATMRRQRWDESLTVAVPIGSAERAAIVEELESSLRTNGAYVEPRCVELVRRVPEGGRVFAFPDPYPYKETAVSTRVDSVDDWTFGRLSREAERLGVKVTADMRMPELRPLVRAAMKAERDAFAAALAAPAKVEPAEEEAPAPSIEPRSVEPATPDWQSMTVAQLREELAAFRITPPSRATKAALIAMLEDAV